MTRIRHERQRYSWDCGLACTRMILKSYDRNVNVLQEICQTFGIRTSVWTVDIASILTSYKIRYLFVTKRAGVDYSYENEPFFAPNFKNDVKRVQKLFDNSEYIKLNIQQRSISEGEIIRHLDTGQPIIILLDWSKIKETTSIFGCLGTSKSSSYQGHYVVLVSYNDDKECFYYLDPERNSRKRKMKRDDLERARKSYGTDEDLILIYDD